MKILTTVMILSLAVLAGCDTTAQEDEASACGMAYEQLQDDCGGFYEQFADCSDGGTEWCEEEWQHLRDCTCRVADDQGEPCDGEGNLAEDVWLADRAAYACLVTGERCDQHEGWCYDESG